MGSDCISSWSLLIFLLHWLPFHIPIARTDIYSESRLSRTMRLGCSSWFSHLRGRCEGFFCLSQFSCKSREWVCWYSYFSCSCSLRYIIQSWMLCPWWWWKENVWRVGVGIIADKRKVSSLHVQFFIVRARDYSGHRSCCMRQTVADPEGLLEHPVRSKLFISFSLGFLNKV